MPREKLQYVKVEEPGCIRSFDEVESYLYLADGRWRAHRKMQRNTLLNRVPKGIALTFYNQPLLTWHPDNMVTLDSHLYYTVTTRQRISSWLPVNIYEKSGYWWLYLPIGDRPFHDGMMFDLVTLTEFGPRYNIEEVVEHNRKWEPKIEEYAERFGSLKTGTPWHSQPIELTTQEIMGEVERKETPGNILSLARQDLRMGWVGVSDAIIVEWYLKLRLLQGAYTGRKARPDVSGRKTTTR